MFSLKLVIIVLYQRMAPLHYSKIKITSNFSKKEVLRRQGFTPFE